LKPFQSKRQPSAPSLSFAPADPHFSLPRTVVALLPPGGSTVPESIGHPPELRPPISRA
jgi:hypothetical protein